MKNNFYLYITILFLVFTLCIACNDKNKKKEYLGRDISVDKVKIFKNISYISMDSLEIISHISEQKLQQIYDLALLANENRSNQKIDTAIISQLTGYFKEDERNDSINTYRLLKELDTLNVKYIDFKLIPIKNDSIVSDSIGKIFYNVNYYNRNKKYILTREKFAAYILEKIEKNKFKFYFSSINDKEE